MVLRLGLELAKDVGDAVVEVEDRVSSVSADLVVAVGGNAAVSAKGELVARVDVAAAILEEAGSGLEDGGSSHGGKRDTHNGQWVSAREVLCFVFLH